MKHNLLIRLVMLVGAVVLTGNVWGADPSIIFQATDLGGA